MRAAALACSLLASPLAAAGAPMSPAPPSAGDAARTTRRLFQTLVESLGISNPPRFVYKGDAARGYYDCPSRSVVADDGAGDAGSESCPDPGAHAAVFMTSEVWDQALTCSEDSASVFGEEVAPEEALALVLAHELSHVSLRHSPKKRQWLREHCIEPPPGWPSGSAWDGNWIGYLATRGSASRAMAERLRAEILAKEGAERERAIEIANYGICGRFLPGFRRLTLDQELEAVRSSHQMLRTLRDNRALAVGRCAGLCAEFALTEIEARRGADRIPPDLRTHPTPEERVEIARAWAQDCPASAQTLAR